MVEFKDQFSAPQFAKDQSEVEILKSALERKDLDRGMAPILERFFSLPLTPWQSCTGHIEKKVDDRVEITNRPHFSYTEDEVTDVVNKEIQSSFREKLPELE